jgi:TatD DNase family protein
VERRNWARVRELAHDLGHVYALGIHPLYVPQMGEGDVVALDEALQQYAHDPRLVAVGEIGLDFFVPYLSTPAMRERQQQVYHAQLQLARRYQLPVLLHVRHSVDVVLKHLREVRVVGGIAHAFNGSMVQAQVFIQLGFKLGFGGAMTFDTARRLRALATQLPLSALVLETDAPDIPPQWLYATAAQRAAGQPQGINTPAELPRIAQVLAELRACSVISIAEQTTKNASSVLPRLQSWLEGGLISGAAGA